MTAPPSRSGAVKVGRAVAIGLGGIIGLAVAVAAVIGLGLLFWLLLREMFSAIGEAIGDAISDAF